MEGGDEVEGREMGTENMWPLLVHSLIQERERGAKRPCRVTGREINLFRGRAFPLTWVNRGQVAVVMDTAAVAINRPAATALYSLARRALLRK